jgi:phosphatidylinositol glycan class A protein
MSISSNGHHGHGRRHRIAMVCDFFYPRLGGVENHIWSLAHTLLHLGHKVIVITHAYNCPDADSSVDDDGGVRTRKSKRCGVRYLPGGLKVYHCPFIPMTDEVCLPTFTVSFPLLRWIFIREGIEIVHSHQATSAMGNEAITYAAELGLASVYTDHSLFGFDDIASIVLNRVRACKKIAMICYFHIYCGSYISWIKFGSPGIKSNNVHRWCGNMRVKHLQRELHIEGKCATIHCPCHSQCSRLDAVYS